MCLLSIHGLTRKKTEVLTAISIRSPVDDKALIFTSCCKSLQGVACYFCHHVTVFLSFADVKNTIFHVSIYNIPQCCHTLVEWVTWVGVSDHTTKRVLISRIIKGTHRQIYCRSVTSESFGKAML